MSRFLSSEWLVELRQALSPVQANASEDDARMVVQQVVTVPDGTEICYVVELSAGPAEVRAGRADDFTVSLTQSYAVAAALSLGSLSVRSALLAGQLQIRGDPAALVDLGERLDVAQDPLSQLRSRTTY
ncbi:MAG: hypothetical protein ACRD0E_03750 [Acidimicrobiales bacterium]